MAKRPRKRPRAKHHRNVYVDDMAALMIRIPDGKRERLKDLARARKQSVTKRMFVTETGRLDGPRWVINFPTKKDWRHPSRLENVRAGLGDLVRLIRELGVKSVALPALGCGSGGLDWAQVKRAIEAAMAKLPVATSRMTFM